MISARQLAQRAQKRRRVKHERSFEDRLMEEIERFTEAAAAVAPGMERELLLKRVRQAETALRVSEWLKSPGLRPPV